MSGICGLVRLDGGQATTEQLLPLWRALAHRGPDGGGCWARGHVAFGFRLLATTPHAAAEDLPLHHFESGCAIVADARLDNREELAASLNIDPRGRGDGELILLSFLKWGHEAPLHLLGDFAFAVWDARNQCLFAARDPVGMRQLHYAYLPGKLIAFATDDHAVAAHPDIPGELNETRIADFLEDLEGADLTSTFIRAVQRLAPAHYLVVTGSELRVTRYWSPEAQQPLELASDADYAAAFLHHLEQAVSCRLSGSAGAMLSGGLDSSSIVVVAARLRRGRPLLTFSAVDASHGDCEETAMSRLVQALPGVQPVEVDVAEAPLRASRIASPLGRRNAFDRTMALPAYLYEAAARTGLNVVLDGASADVVLAHRNHNARLIRKGCIREAWEEAKGFNHFWREAGGPYRSFFADVRTAVVPEWARVLKERSTLTLQRLTCRSSVLTSEFARQVDIGERRHLLSRATPNPNLPYSEDRAGIVLHNNLVVARERYDRVASEFAIEARDPFVDMRLIQFALSLPPRQLVRQGWTKYVTRVATKGLLPDEVRWRRGKTHLGAQFIAASDLNVTQDARLVNSRTELRRWIKAEVLKQAASPAASPDTWMAHRVRSLAKWLDGRDR